MNKRELLKYIASLAMLIIIVGLVAYLTFIPVPTENKDIIITVLGVILGGGAAAMPNLFGDRDAETEKLKDRIRSLEQKLAIQETQYNEVRGQYDRLIEALISRHIIPETAGVPPLLPSKFIKGEEE